MSTNFLGIKSPMYKLQLEKLISKNYFLHQSAKEAFKNCIRAYDTSFEGLRYRDSGSDELPNRSDLPLAVDLKMGISKASRPRKRLGGGGYGHFKNINDPSSAKRLKRTKTFRQIGQRGQDNRQFSR